jgi:hypothetical protein
MLYSVLGVLFIISASASFILFSYNFVVMLGGVKQEKKRLIHYLGPLVLFFPKLYDDIGNRERIKAIAYVILMVGSIAAMFLTHRAH